MSRENKGLFIVIEGSNGSGKSTLINHLVERLEQNYEIVRTREPGDTELGAKLRELLLPNESNICDEAELMLFCADRAQHVRDVVRPALARGAVVISDRYDWSSAAFQSYGRGLPIKTFNKINDVAIDGVEPDLTIILDLDVETGLKRVNSRGDKHDRMEACELEMLERVRTGYLDLAHNSQRHTAIIDATEEPNKVVTMAMQTIQRKLPAATRQADTKQTIEIEMTPYTVLFTDGGKTATIEGCQNTILANLSKDDAGRSAEDNRFIRLGDNEDIIAEVDYEDGNLTISTSDCNKEKLELENIVDWIDRRWDAISEIGWEALLTDDQLCRPSQALSM